MLPDKFWRFSPLGHQKFAKIATFLAKFRPFFAHFWQKILYFLTPSTRFIAILCDNVWKNWNFIIFFKKIAMWNTFTKVWKNWEMKGQKTLQLLTSFLGVLRNSPKLVEMKLEKFWIFGHFLGKNWEKWLFFTKFLNFAHFWLFWRQISPSPIAKNPSPTHLRISPIWRNFAKYGNTVRGSNYFRRKFARKFDFTNFY